MKQQQPGGSGSQTGSCAVSAGSDSDSPHGSDSMEIEMSPEPVTEVLLNGDDSLGSFDGVEC